MYAVLFFGGIILFSVVLVALKKKSALKKEAKRLDNLHQIMGSVRPDLKNQDLVIGFSTYTPPTGEIAKGVAKDIAKGFAMGAIGALAGVRVRTSGGTTTQSQTTNYMISYGNNSLFFVTLDDPFTSKNIVPLPEYCCYFNKDNILSVDVKSNGKVNFLMKENDYTFSFTVKDVFPSGYTQYTDSKKFKEFITSFASYING